MNDSNVEYAEFLATKIAKSVLCGFECETSNENLFPFQHDIVRWALRKGRAALFLDTGLGKTLCQLSWACEICKHTKGKILVVAPLAVSKQTQREGRKFGIEVNICRKQRDVKDGINITNYEMLEYFKADEFVGVVLDESSILKSYMGATKMLIVKMFENTQYKLTCTATPLPNNHMEILNQAEFLGVMKSHEALAIWFINDTSQSGNYVLKGHAVKPFWEWVSTWAVCISKPSDIGHSDDGYILPPLNEKVEIVKSIKHFQNGEFFKELETSATSFHKEKRLSSSDRALKCAEIAKQTNEQYLIWCNTDYEADELKKALPKAVEVRGSQTTEKKEQIAMDFIDGKIRVLISKPKIFGYGLNFQNCRNTIFCGIDYSYESYYQAVRRFWRFGQTKEVNVHLVIGIREKQILTCVRGKAEKQNEMKANMYGSIKEIQNASIKGVNFSLNLNVPKIKIPDWLKTEAT
jgi:superfamily II DNA or RNA helicase